MAISTANELRTAVQNWCNDASGGILTTDRLNEMIVLAEAWLNRKVRAKGMVESFATVALSANGSATLPTGFLAWKFLRLDADIDYTLQPKSLEWIRAQGSYDTSEARYFAVTSTLVVCWPLGGSITGHYYKSLTSLSGLTTTGNWLLTSHPDLYLAATLTEAALYLKDEQMANLWRQRAAATLDEVNRADEEDAMDGGILAVRAR